MVANPHLTYVFILKYKITQAKIVIMAMNALSKVLMGILPSARAFLISSSFIGVPFSNCRIFKSFQHQRPDILDRSRAIAEKLLMKSLEVKFIAQFIFHLFAQLQYLCLS